jgi:hypothetical protein
MSLLFSYKGLPCDLTITPEVTLSLFLKEEIISNLEATFDFVLTFAICSRHCTVQYTQSFEK